MIARVSQMFNSDAAAQLCTFGAVDQAYEVGCSIRTNSQYSRETFSVVPCFF